MHSGDACEKALWCCRVELGNATQDGILGVAYEFYADRSFLGFTLATGYAALWIQLFCPLTALADVGRRVGHLLHREPCPNQEVMEATITPQLALNTYQEILVRVAVGAAREEVVESMQAGENDLAHEHDGEHVGGVGNTGNDRTHVGACLN
ncbi:hypothetical protein K491DRAFT_685107 [Lophiostoma macrostomum CBS 122681]|uniref:Uncharacterized protein n=1 Tax=Lophiostoma macrostomum CBS 122681 TaxID=1314788 RepID=A0A6A6SP28_9PLEO|nr:hypothetical protein K491DRAFT_685107 [Lophiostoma macrostomum CBS 122681]